MTTNHFTAHDLFNQPIRLSAEEQARPLEVLREFFQNCHLGEVRQTLWQAVENALAADNTIYDRAEQRDHLLWFYRHLERTLEAGLLLCKEGVYKKAKPVPAISYLALQSRPGGRDQAPEDRKRAQRERAEPPAFLQGAWPHDDGSAAGVVFLAASQRVTPKSYLHFPPLRPPHEITITPHFCLLCDPLRLRVRYLRETKSASPWKRHSPINNCHREGEQRPPSAKKNGVVAAVGVSHQQRNGNKKSLVGSTHQQGRNPHFKTCAYEPSESTTRL